MRTSQCLYNRVSSHLEIRENELRQGNRGKRRENDEDSGKIEYCCFVLTLDKILCSVDQKLYI